MTIRRQHVVVHAQRIPGGAAEIKVLVRPQDAKALATGGTLHFTAAQWAAWRWLLTSNTDFMDIEVICGDHTPCVCIEQPRFVDDACEHCHGHEFVPGARELVLRDGVHWSRDRGCTCSPFDESSIERCGMHASPSTAA